MSDIPRWKFPRTPHHRLSEKSSSDDIYLSTPVLSGKDVVATVKFDGSNVSIYSDGFVHARSLNNSSHASLDNIKSIAPTIASMLHPGWRVVLEDCTYTHTIPYRNLDSFHYIIALFNAENEVLDWTTTKKWAEQRALSVPPAIDRFPYDEILDWPGLLSWGRDIMAPDRAEGIVIRNADGFHYDQWAENVAKIVFNDFDIADNPHWRRGKIVKNSKRKVI